MQKKSGFNFIHNKYKRAIYELVSRLITYINWNKPIKSTKAKFLKQRRNCGRPINNLSLKLKPYYAWLPPKVTVLLRHL